MRISDEIPERFRENQAYVNILGRVSVRRYADRPVDDEQVSALLHAALFPSAILSPTMPRWISGTPNAYIANNDRIIPYRKKVLYLQDKEEKHYSR